jgi:hypothetical protein
MAVARPPIMLSGMDRSLNGDDFRLFSRWEREDHPERFATASARTLDDLPGWFRQLAREQAIELGCEALFPELFLAAKADRPEAA